jgi:hypothetical protein
VRGFESEGWSVWWDRAIHAGARFDRAYQRYPMALATLAARFEDLDRGMFWFGEAARSGDFNAILQSRLWLRLPPRGQARLREAKGREDYQAILGSLGIDDASIEGLVQAVGDDSVP